MVMDTPELAIQITDSPVEEKTTESSVEEKKKETPKVPKTGSFQRQNVKLFFLYVSPWIIGFAAFTIVPMIFSLMFSFTNVVFSTATTKPMNVVGFKNFAKVFEDTAFLTSIGNTFLMAILKVVLLTICSLLIAVLLNQKIPGKKVWRVFVYLPSVIPVVSCAMLWELMFKGLGSSQNIVSYALSLIGINNVAFLEDPFLSKMVIVFIGVWGGLGPNMFIFLAALQGVPNDIIEASSLDGAGACRRFFSIVVPTIAPTVFFVSLTGMIGSLQMYAEVELLTGGGPGGATNTMNLLIVLNAFDSTPGGKTGMGYACAQAWIVFLIVLILTITVNTIKARLEREKA